jgi:hypothetical protein
MPNLLVSDYMYHEVAKPDRIGHLRSGQLQALVHEQRKVLIDLLLFDQVIVLTGDLSPVLFILEAFGQEIVQHALSSGALRLMCLSENIGFINNSKSIGAFSILEPDNKTPASAAYAPLNEKIQNFLELGSPLYGSDIHMLERPLEKSCVAVELKDDIQAINPQIFDDFQSSSLIAERYPISRNTKVLQVKPKPSGETQVTRLEDTSLRTPPSCVEQALLRIAHSHLNLYLGAKYGAYAQSAPSFLNMLEDINKQRPSSRETARIEFLELCKVARVPDVERALTDGTLSAGDIFGLRESQAGKALRGMVATAHSGEGAGTLAQAYCDLLEDRVHRGESWVKWVLLEGLGYLTPPGLASLAGKALEAASHRGRVVAFFDQLRDMTLAR